MERGDGKDNHRLALQTISLIHYQLFKLLKVMGLIDSVVSCHELCESIVAEAEAVINGRLSNSVTTTADDR